MSLTGYPDQYSTGSGVAFQYQTVCYGRDTFAYYDTYAAIPAFLLTPTPTPKPTPNPP